MKKILLTTATVALLSTSAFAMEAGKMYFRGDAGYQFSNLKNNLLGDTDSKKLKGFSGDIGFGYALSDSFRTDVTLNFSQGKGKQKADKLPTGGISYKIKNDTKALDAEAGTVTATEKNMGLLFNGYYDFHNSSAFTPYIMGGVGVNRGKMELKFAGKQGNENKDFTIKSGNKTGILYQVGFGANYEVSKDVLIDVGYKLQGHTSKYKFKFKDDEEFKIGSNTYKKDSPFDITKKEGDQKGMKSSALQHTITAGVVFAF